MVIKKLLLKEEKIKNKTVSYCLVFANLIIVLNKILVSQCFKFSEYSYLGKTTEANKAKLGMCVFIYVCNHVKQT